MFYLLWERIILLKRIRKIPLRICVTGTRGKSSVARLIASILNEAGYSVIAKTTGSKPTIIFPDRKEEEIKRIGRPSILENKRILKIGTNLQVQALVLELMSFQPETLFSESVQMVQPDILIITNVLLDHLEQMGSSKSEIARSLTASISANCTVFIPEGEWLPVFKDAGERVGSQIVQVTKEPLEEIFKPNKSTSLEFEDNLRLACAMSEFLGVENKHIIQGIKKVQSDFGSLKMWQTDAAAPLRPSILISAFSANDPESTLSVVSKVKEKVSFEGKRIIGFLNLRKDRGDRTTQWQKALSEKGFSDFHRIVLIGGHAQALKRKLRTKRQNVSIIQEKLPEKIMADIEKLEKEEYVLFGMGNMGGAGQRLVEHWEKMGRPYDI